MAIEALARVDNQAEDVEKAREDVEEANDSVKDARERIRNARDQITAGLKGNSLKSSSARLLN